MTRKSHFKYITNKVVQLIISQCNIKVNNVKENMY